MNCPFCNKRIEGMTGFQEASKFQKHLAYCRKNPNRRQPVVTPEGDIKIQLPTLLEALTIRAESGQ